MNTVNKVTKTARKNIEKLTPDVAVPDDVTRKYILLAIVVAVATWDISFNFGAHKVIFFEKFFLVWIVSLAILLADFALEQKRILKGWALVAMMAPTFTMGLTIWANTFDAEFGILNTGFFLFSTLLTILFLPYAAYIILSVTHVDMVRIQSKRLLGWLVGIAVIVATLGITIGHFNRFFLTCESFQVSGNDTPDNCSSEDRSFDARF